VATGRREVRANGGLEARVLVFTSSTREDSGAESVSSRRLAIDEVDKRTEDGS
jgi:hypothetical protein